jgi:hypothetical protein
MSGCAFAMEVCERAAAVFMHRETQHIVSGLQAYARPCYPSRNLQRQNGPIIMLNISNLRNYADDFPGMFFRARKSSV